MTVDEVMRFRRASPFKAFLVELVDGRRFPVRQPEHIGRNEAGTQIIVAAEEDGFAIFQPSAVNQIKLIRNGSRRDGGNRRRKQ